ncbi:MAG TPA: DUF1501 domain-containing protein [Gemmataceae bacterium]|nr:DUF1501 domain-containing protein [Gemmataceae bacterium]
MTSRPSQLSRRDWLRFTSAGVASCCVSGWFDALANDAAAHPKRKKACILLWMTGGPSQMETFDMKPGHVNGGPFKGIPTAVPGIRISEHLPRIARHMDQMVLVRSMSTKEGDHTRATHYLRTGNLPQGPIQYPALPALVSKELGDESAALPNSVSIAPFKFFSPAAHGPGFLGPKYAPLVVGETAPYNGTGATGTVYDQSLKVKNLDLPSGVTPRQRDARVELLAEMQGEFAARHPGVASASNQTAYARALRLMRSEAVKAFDLDREPAALRDAYGRNQFGQGCLLARRLVERGVPFVEVTLGGVNGEAFVPFAWDGHTQIFDNIKSLSGTLDAGWATLMMDLKARGLLDSTLIVWMGEFGRTPKINPQNGRDHYPNAWTTVLSGGGIKGGQVVGKTSPDGSTVEERPVAVIDFLATICLALGIDPRKENMSDIGRPIRIVDKSAKPIREVLA